MKFVKSLLTNSFLMHICSCVVSGYIRLVYHTSRWQILGKEKAEAVLQGEKPVIFAFWHGRLLLMPYLRPPHRPMHAMISRHKDGELIAGAMRNFGFGWIQGSTNKGGSHALREAIRCLKKGDNIAITPDGPRGPRMRVNGTILALSRMTGCPIIPITYSINNARIAKSWDKFMIAKPFGQGVLMYGNPVSIAEGTTEERLKQAEQELENNLNTITRQADTLTGIKEIIAPEEVER